MCHKTILTKTLIEISGSISGLSEPFEILKIILLIADHEQELPAQLT